MSKKFVSFFFPVGVIKCFKYVKVQKNKNCLIFIFSHNLLMVFILFFYKNNKGHK